MNRRQQRVVIVSLLLLLAVTAAWALLPENLRSDSLLRTALYRSEFFRGRQVHVPLPPAESRRKLTELAAGQPQNAEVHKALSEVQVRLLDFPAAEAHLRQYLQLSPDKDAAYSALESYYHSRLNFDAELQTMLDRARAAAPHEEDIDAQTGPFGHYRRAIRQIDRYKLSADPASIHQAIVDTYPNHLQPYIDFIEFTKHANPQRSRALLGRMKEKFPDNEAAYLQASCSLLSNQEAFSLLDQNFQPLWDMQLVKLLDSYAVSSGKKGEYLERLKDRLRKNPLDLDAASRAFYSYHLAGNIIEAQQILHDFRLLKEQSVREGQGSWNAAEISAMAQFSRLLMNFDDEARYNYSLYMMLRGRAPQSKVTADDALYGLFRVLATADQRPLQLGAGNIDYYKDIATADSHPGVLNGILSLLFNSADPASEWAQQQPKVIGYYNRAQALRLIHITQRDYPHSPHLPAMYRDALKIYEKYAMNDLIVQAGEQFFKTYPAAPEILDVGIAVADAYSRLNDHENEWKTYDDLLPVAASMEKGRLIADASRVQTSGYEYQDDYEDDYEDEEYEWEEKPARRAAERTGYESLLNRYISSLTQQKNHIAVVNLYKSEIVSHPDEEGLYENFAAFLSSNRLLDEEERVYRQAIQQFQEKSWHEKLARWYLRHERQTEFEMASRQIIDTFEGTDVAAYLQSTVPSFSNPYRALFAALNQYAQDRFPYNLVFVKNLMALYFWEKNMSAWEALAIQYYPLDETIRTEYLRWLSRSGNLPPEVQPSNPVETRFAADILVWRSHFEEAAPHYRKLSEVDPSDRQLNTLLADITRSLGAFDPQNYDEAARLREHLAQIEPSDAALWTAAGETMADTEDFDRAKAYWQNILKIDPQNEDRYLEVATILWDYYLFDDALAVIEQSRKIENDPELFAYEAGAIQESKRRYDLAIAEYSKSLFQNSDSARGRLLELYGRPRLTPIVRATLEQRLKEFPQQRAWWLGIIGFYSDLKDSDTARGMIERAITTLSQDEFSKAASILKTKAADLGFQDLQEKMLQLEVKRASTELERIQLTLDLARFYEAQSRNEFAEATYRQLYTTMPRSAGIINELLSYYWRTGKYTKAFEIYDEILPAANATYRTHYLLESARRHIERNDYAPALKAAQELNAKDPMNMAYFQLVAEIYAGQQNFADLREHYKQGLESIRKSPLPDEQKKVQIAAIRRGIISANLILKDYTAALDQYIEILNRDAENTELLQEVSTFAMKHGLSGRVVEYYTRTAQASPKDHRWPMTLGRLRFFSGEFESAINDFKSAIAIRPERTDLRQQLAESYQRLGRYADAITTYEKLYAMTYKDKRWLDPLSELHARLGNRAKAIELYQQSLSAELTPMQRSFSLAGKTLEWGIAAEAAKYGELAMKSYHEDRSEMLESYGLQQYTEALVRSGSSLKALEMLIHTYSRVKEDQLRATFDSETLRSTEYVLRDQITRGLPELIKEYLTGDQIQALDHALLQNPAVSNHEWKRDVFLPMARQAGMARAEEQLLRELAEKTFRGSDSHYRNDRDQLRQFYIDRMAYASCAQWLEEQWRLNRSDDYREDLVDIAQQYRRAGLLEKELNILREYYEIGKRRAIHPEPVERYLSLLYSISAQEELQQAADAGSYYAANYFIKRKDHPLAQRAVDAIAGKQPAVWSSIQRAMIARELGTPVESVQTAYNAALDFRTIGEQVTQSSNHQTSVHGDDWFYYTTRYGQHLWWGGQKDSATHYLISDLEGAPTNGARQMALGDFYIAEKQYAFALEHYTFASQLDPQMPEYQDRTARALFLNQRKDEALALWKQMISLPRAPRYELLLNSALEYGFLDTVRPDIEAFLTQRIEREGPAGLGILAPRYLGSLSVQDGVPLIEKWISTGNPEGIAFLMLENQELDPVLTIHILRSASETMKSRMMSAAGSARQNYRHRYLSWALRYADQSLKSGNADRALSISRETMEHAAADTSMRDRILLLQCKALIRSGKKKDALDVLQQYYAGKTVLSDLRIDEERYRTASELLESEGLKTDANDLREKLYERLIESGRTEDANYAGLARVKLEKNEPEQVRRLLERLIYATSENLNGFHVAAELMEEFDRIEDAIEYRQELAKRLQSDMKNNARLSMNLLAAGRSQEAAQTAARVLKSDLSTAEERVAAARVFAKTSVEQAGPAEIQKLVRALRASQPALSDAGVYDRIYRALLLKNATSPPIEFLLAQKYVDPQDEALNVQLFEAYRRAGRCDLALLVLDPDDDASQSEYQPRPDEDSEYPDSGRYDYNYYRTYPVEELDLGEEKTRDLALAMAECAEKTGQDASRIFYLQMSLHHTPGEKDRLALLQRIKKAQAESDEKTMRESQRYKVAENLGRQS